MEDFAGPQADRYLDGDWQLMSVEDSTMHEPQTPSAEGAPENEQTTATSPQEEGVEPAEVNDDSAAEEDLPPVVEESDRLKELEDEVAEHKDRYMRAAAELQNYKKRTSREMDDMRRYANEALLRELLPVVDNLERALSISCDDGDAAKGISEGVDLTLKEILKVFEKFNVKPIEALEKPFDPNFHQAVSREERDDCADNTVINEFQKGYLIHDRLLRPSMVVVSMAKKE